MGYNMKHPKKLKSQLIIYFTTLILVSTMFISLFQFYNSKKTLEQNMISNATGTINYIMDNIDKQLALAEQLSDWIFINKTLEKILTRDYTEQPSRLDSDMWTFWDIEDLQLRNSGIGKYVMSVLIEGNNSIDLRWGIDASYIDKEKIQNDEWFQKQLDNNGKVYWYGIIENPASFTYENNVFPVVRPIIHSSLNTKIGWSLINFKESLISDVFKKFNTDTSKSIYVIDQRGVCVSSTDRNLLGNDLSNQSQIQKILDMGDGNFPIQINNEKTLLVFHKSQHTGWIIVQELSYSFLDKQKNVLLKMTLMILLAVLLISSVMTVYLSFRITRPVSMLQKRLKQISDGNFTRDVTVEGDDELGTLGKGLNLMSSDINKLLDRLLEEESVKRRLEINMLQSQINPHFLYNTLNTIKWIAIIQKADGVRDAVSALGRLLRNTICDADEKITIKEEVEILKDYMYIQNLRYNGSVDVQYSFCDEDIQNHTILKLTLQPIVENAIFHGIEPKKAAGTIKITFSNGESNISICIEDDGVGMTEEQIKDVLSGRKHEEKLRGMSGVGVNNVSERLKLSYGKEYGINIESVVGEYTKVYITIPREYKAV